MGITIYEISAPQKQTVQVKQCTVSTLTVNLCGAYSLYSVPAGKENSLMILK